jgi:hypothetical protein
MTWGSGACLVHQGYGERTLWQERAQVGCDRGGLTVGDTPCIEKPGHDRRCERSAGSQWSILLGGTQWTTSNNINSPSRVGWGLRS